MTVKDLFPGNAFTPFREDIGAAAAGAGPQPVVNHTLAGLADLIQLPANAQAAAPQARPNPLANVTSFVSDILRVNHQLGAQAVQGVSRAAVLEQLAAAEPEVHARYIEWTALSAMVALRGVYSMYGLQVEMEPMELDAGRYLFDRALLFALYNMSPAYRFQVTGTDPNTGRPATGRLFYLTQNGKPFAIYSDEIGVCPMVYYAGADFADLVPWYQAGEDAHKSWRDPLACRLGDYAENRFKWWMVRNGRQNAVEVPAPAALAVYDRCATVGGWEAARAGLTALYQNGSPENEARSAAFCTVCGGYLDADNVPRLLPMFFTYDLLLAHKTSPDEPCGLGCDTAGGWQPLALTGSEATRAQLPQMDLLVPVIPFTRAAAALCGSEFEIVSLAFEAQAAGPEQLACVQMHAELQFNDLMQQRLTFTRTYPIDRIQGGVLPYLMVWPWVPLPEHSWNRFYATQKASDAGMNQMYGEGFSGALTLQMTEGAARSVQEKGNPDAAAEGWQVVCSQERFRYALVHTAEGAPRGVVFIPRVKAHPAPAVPADYEVSVDFGTTSTVCAIKDTRGNVDFLPYVEFGRNVTIGDQVNDIEKVAQKRWLGRASARTGSTLLARKTLSAAQLFDLVRGDGDQDDAMQMFLDGRFFLATSTLLCGYTANGDFEHQGIYNDLKLSTDNDIGKTRAGELFLAGVYIQALLYVLSANDGAGRIRTLRVSYPGALTRNILGARWNQAAALVNRCLSGGAGSAYALDPAQIQYCTEAQAAQLYNEAHAVAMSKYLNVDIGGGTTDLSVVLADPAPAGSLPTLSFKYAGREIMINSFIQAYRRWKEDGDQTLAQRHFKKIWGAPLDPQVDAAYADVVRDQLTDRFFKRCATMTSEAQQLSAQQDETLRTLLEILMNDFDMALPNTGDYNLLREVFSLKFFLLMRMVAEFMARNPETLAQMTDLVVTDEGEEVESLCISLTGTAAMTLQHVFNLPLQQLQQLDSIGMDTPAQRMLHAVAAMMARVMGKDRLAITLRLSADVREKKEVAFGVLHGDSFAAQAVRLTATPAQVFDLIFQMDGAQRRDWYRTTFGAPLLADEEKQRDQVAKKLDAVTAVNLEKYKNDLSQKVNAAQLNREIDTLQKETGDLEQKVERIFQEWSDFAETPDGTWPPAAPVDANVGLGRGKTRLSEVLPMGIGLINSIREALRNMKSGSEMRYLSSISEEGYRETLLTMYVVERIINQALYQNQK